MPPFGRGRKATFKSVKIEAPWTFLATDLGTATVNAFTLTCVEGASKDLETEVLPGTLIPYIFIEFNLSAAATGVVKVVHWIVMKNPGNLIGGVNPLDYGQNYKKFIFKRGVEMLPNNVATLVKRVFVVKIPKRYQRMDVGDNLALRVRASTTETINFCGVAITKVET